MIADSLAGSATLFVGVAFLFGLLIGSFLNVVIHRLPIMMQREWRVQAVEVLADAGQSVAVAAAAGESTYNLVTPRSACPACGAAIRAAHNVPVISWIALRGRCSSCAARISARYPLIEALTGLTFAAVAWKFGLGWPALAAMLLTAFLLALAAIDFDTQYLPDGLTLPLLWIGLGLSLFATASGAAIPVDPRSSIIGAIAGYLSLWCVYHLFKLATGQEGMGYGDFKLLAALGAWLGWKMLLPIVLISALVGAIVGIALITLRGRDRRAPMPFGPFIAAAGWIALMFGAELVASYLRLFGP